MNNGCEIWAVIPAAGIGKRMQSDIPKQYLNLVGRPVIEHTINRLLAVEKVRGVVVSLQADDPYWPDVHFESDMPVYLAAGGNERCHSVINALDTLSGLADYKSGITWALVHDAVRPCVSIDDISNLIEYASVSEAGGLLAMPVRDTMKRQDKNQRVSQTVDRTGLWHALTPQLFPCDTLRMALKTAVAAGLLVTDESSAMEHAGYHPRLVEGREDNIKITRPADLHLAGLLMQAMSLESTSEGRQ